MSTAMRKTLLVLCTVVSVFMVLFFAYEGFSHATETERTVYMVSEVFQVIFMLLICFILLQQLLKKEKLLHIKNQLYQTLYESEQNLIFLLDAEGQFLQINATVSKFIGIREDEVVGNHYSMYVRKQFMENVTACFEKALDGMISTCYLEFVTTEGKDFRAETRFSPVFIEGKINYVVIALKDVTEKTAVKMKLVETERNLKLINEHASEMFSILNRDGHMLFTTPSFEYVFGKNPNDYYGKNPLEALDDADEIHQATEIFLDSIKTGEKLFHSFSRQNEHGERLYFETVGTPVIEEDGAINHVVCVVRDVTEQKQQETRIQQTERMNLIGGMAAGIAHEIKNPLTSIRGFIQLFQAKDQEETHERFYELVLTELDRVNEIVSDLLTLSKPKKLKVTTFDVEQTLQSVLHLMNNMAVEKSIQVEYQKNEEAIWMEGDENQLKQVMINVIKNAIEATESHKRIRIVTEKEASNLVVSITDEGCGFTEEQLIRLGEAFYSSKENGTGLGILVSKRILDDHGGYIEFNSTLEKGTTVKITLPLVQKAL